LRATPKETASLVERQRLFDRLIRIQRSLSHGASLQDVLEATTEGASELMGDGVAALRLIDETDPSYCYLAAACGLDDEVIEEIRRIEVGEGVAGLAIREDKLVVMLDYQRETGALEPLARRGIQAAMAAPVHEQTRVVGSLVVASHEPGRTYSENEQEALLAFAQHAGLALSDSRSLDAMREAQRAKDMFIAMASHGMKTPLTVIMGTLVTLKKNLPKLDPELVEEMLESAYQRSVELDRSIERILEGARAELAGTRRAAYLPDVIGSAIGGFAQSRPLRTSEVPQLELVLDVESVHQILGILLENAVAHSAEGTEIGINVGIDGDDLSISVSNHGSLPDDLEPDDLFMPFRRGHGARSSGVGLGLYIASELTRAIKGRLGVVSRAGIVTFTLEITVEPPEPESL
jgi:K+-sensing histidine kinase KdpD